MIGIYKSLRIRVSTPAVIGGLLLLAFLFDRLSRVDREPKARGLTKEEVAQLIAAKTDRALDTLRRRGAL
jgi:hypothetical protein